MNWRDDPQTPPFWIEFADRLIAAHPEWEPSILGPIAGHRRYPPDDVRFFVEIPSEHPTIREPLTIEAADPDAGGPIDTYWNGYFDPNPCGSERSRWPEQIDAVVRRIERWTSDDWIFRLYTEPRRGRRVRGPIRYGDGTCVSTDEMPFVQWSWRGTHDAKG